MFTFPYLKDNKELFSEKKQQSRENRLGPVWLSDFGVSYLPAQAQGLQKVTEISGI